MITFSSMVLHWINNGSTKEERVQLLTAIQGVDNLSGTFIVELKKVLHEQGKLHGVKLLRSATEWSLVDCKNYCDLLVIN